MTPIQHLRQADSRLSKVIDRVGELDYTTYNDSTDGFSFLVKEIVGQMISSHVKHIIWDRLLTLCGNTPTPSNICSLSTEKFRDIGLSRSKSFYIHNLAEIVTKNEINFEELELLTDNEVIKILTSIKGIGNWTAKMYLIFFLQREDVLPFEDGAFLQAYRWLYNTNSTTPNDISKRCSKWKPYTSIGARYLYKALDIGLTKTPINIFLSE